MDFVKVAVCESANADRHHLAEIVGEFLDGIDVKYSISQYKDGREFLEAEEEFDIVFLNLELPKVNGMEVAKQLYESDKSCFIIFTALCEKDWREGYKVQAFRFLVKPLQQQEVEEAVCQIIKIRCANRIIFCKSSQRFYIPVKDILYVEPSVKGRGVTVHTANMNVEDTRTMKEYSHLLTADFFYRTHRSCYVNMDYIVSYDQFNIHLKSGEQVWMSCKRRKRFIEVFESYKLKRGSL